MRGRLERTKLNPKTRLRLVVLGAAAFAYVTAETLPVGLLPQLSRGLHVPEGDVGLLVTTYAAVAGLGAIPITARLSHVSRRGIVIASVLILAGSQLAMAVAPGYGFVLAARVVCAGAHGVFWSVLPAVAASLVPPAASGRATSIVFGGSAVALVVGTPLATATGDLLGWRLAEMLVGLIALVVAVLLVALLPGLPASVTPAAPGERLAGLVALVRRGPLVVICATTALVVTAQFIVYTYIAPIVRHDGDLSGLALSLVLLCYGLAGIVSNAVNGHIVDRRPRLVAVASSCLVVVALVLIVAVAPGSAAVTVGAVALWGAAFGAVPLSLQASVLRVCPDAPDAATSLLVVAFQIGIGGGAFLGALLDRRGSIGVLPAVALGPAIAAAALIVLARATYPSFASPSSPAKADELPVEV